MSDGFKTGGFLPPSDLTELNKKVSHETIVPLEAIKKLLEPEPFDLLESYFRLRVSVRRLAEIKKISFYFANHELKRQMKCLLETRLINAATIIGSRSTNFLYAMALRENWIKAIELYRKTNEQ